MNPNVEVAFRAVEVSVLAVTSLIVWWYTRETSLLRKAAQEQNVLLKEQVALAKAAQQAAAAQYEAELARVSAQVAPVIGSFGVSYKSQQGPHDAEISFENKGGPMKNLEVEPLGNFFCSIEPTNIVAGGEWAKVKLEGVSLEEPSLFRLNYDNILGKRLSVILEYEKGNIRKIVS